MRRDQQQEEVVLARVPTIQKMLHQHLFLFSRFSLYSSRYFWFVSQFLGLVLLFFITLLSGKGPDISQHLARLSISTLVRELAAELQGGEISPSLPSLDRTNGCEIQSNSRYFRSTVRYNRESNRSNLSAHWFFRICLQFLFFLFFFLLQNNHHFLLFLFTSPSLQSLGFLVFRFLAVADAAKGAK